MGTVIDVSIDIVGTAESSWKPRLQKWEVIKVKGKTLLEKELTAWNTQMYSQPEKWIIFAILHSQRMIQTDLSDLLQCIQYFSSISRQVESQDFVLFVAVCISTCLCFECFSKKRKDRITLLLHTPSYLIKILSNQRLPFCFLRKTSILIKWLCLKIQGEIEIFPDLLEKKSS